MTQPSEPDGAENTPRGDLGNVYLEIVDEDEDGEGFTEDEARQFMERPASSMGRSSAREGA